MNIKGQITLRVLFWAIGLGFIGGILQTKSASIDQTEVITGIQIGSVIGLMVGIAFQQAINRKQK
ncbi:hypothetical protein EDC56_3546 [Sinobacterium caligoides]|uniref:Uncharacterized protein n=1 Tax=Sinobacterium caligoides TaxID=933926 RepID=A0A3N2DDL5_9GAMM|nr:hypothetical protein EDC56_3546 [Sinobacterium caligoides]